MPMRKSAPKSRAAVPAAWQLESSGFWPMPSNTCQGTPCSSRAAVQSSSAPEVFALFLPVTMRHREPRAASCWLFCATTWSPVSILAGMKKLKSMVSSLRYVVRVPL